MPEEDLVLFRMLMTAAPKEARELLPPDLYRLTGSAYMLPFSGWKHLSRLPDWYLQLPVATRLQCGLSRIWPGQVSVSAPNHRDLHTLTLIVRDQTVADLSSGACLCRYAAPALEAIT